MNDYNLEDVANEVAMIYGGEVDKWYVKEDTLYVEYIEHGEVCIGTLRLDEIKDFMEI